MLLASPRATSASIMSIFHREKISGRKGKSTEDDIPQPQGRTKGACSTAKMAHSAPPRDRTLHVLELWKVVC